MNVVVIGPESLRLGFTSAGAAFVAARTPQEVLQCVLDASAKRHAGVLLVVGTLVGPIRNELDRLRAAYTLPPILEIPDLEGTAPPAADPLATVSAAFGIRV